MIIHIPHLDSALRRKAIRTLTTNPHDSNAIRVHTLHLRRLRHDGMQKLREQKRAYVIRAERQLVALRGLRSLRREHNGGIVP